MNRNSCVSAAFVFMVASFLALPAPALALSVPDYPAEVCEPPRTFDGIADRIAWDLPGYNCLSEEASMFYGICAKRGGRAVKVDENFDEVEWGYCQITLACCFPIPATLPTYMDRGNSHIFPGQHK